MTISMTEEDRFNILTYDMICSLYIKQGSIWMVQPFWTPKGDYENIFLHRKSESSHVWQEYKNVSSNYHSFP